MPFSVTALTGSAAPIRAFTMMLALASIFLWSSSWAQGTPPGFEGKPLPIYPGKPTDCYVLLKNQWPYVQGGDYPVCRAVLDNLNKFCDEPPQYNRRKLHPTTKNLREPEWEAMDARNHLELVKEIVLASAPPKYRESRWEYSKDHFIGLATSGQLQLFRADISADLRGGQQTVYKLQNRVEVQGQEALNEPTLMFANAGEEVPAPLFQIQLDLGADLWSFRKHWYLVRFHPDERRFLVKELIRPRVGPEAPIGATPRCTIQHINDNQGVK